MTTEEIRPFLNRRRVSVTSIVDNGTERPFENTLTGVPRNITDVNGNFFPDAGEEHLWLTSGFEHFIPLDSIVAISEVD